MANQAWDALIQQFERDFRAISYDEVYANLIIANIPCRLQQNPRTGDFGVLVTAEDAISWAAGWMNESYHQLLRNKTHARYLWMADWDVELFN